MTGQGVTAHEHQRFDPVLGDLRGLWFGAGLLSSRVWHPPREARGLRPKRPILWGERRRERLPVPMPDANILIQS